MLRERIRDFLVRRQARLAFIKISIVVSATTDLADQAQIKMCPVAACMELPWQLRLFREGTAGTEGSEAFNTDVSTQQA